MGYEEKINRALAESEITGEVLEARKRPLGIGDEIILTVPGPLYFRIADITPNLHPNAPPGLMVVHVACAVAFAVKRGEVNPEFLLIRKAEDAGPSNVRPLTAAENS